MALAEREEDQQQVRDVLAGRRDAFAPLVHRHGAQVRSLCLALLGDPAEADDAAQEVFLKAFRGLARFRTEASFGTWIHRIAHNHCLDLLRSRKRRATESLDALLEKGDAALAGAAGPAPAPATDAQTLLGRLPADYRMVLVLREVQGFSYEEIARTTRASLDSVKARLRRARRALLEAATLLGFPERRTVGDAP